MLCYYYQGRYLVEVLREGQLINIYDKKEQVEMYHGCSSRFSLIHKSVVAFIESKEKMKMTTVDLKFSPVQVEDLLHIIRCYDKIVSDEANRGNVQERVQDLSSRLTAALKGEE